MPLRPMSDVSPADWFVHSDADAWDNVCLGPPGFDAYVRVFYYIGDDDPLDAHVRLRADLRDALSKHTTTPDDAYFGLWVGNGHVDACWAYTETEDGHTQRVWGPEPPIGSDPVLVHLAAFPADVIDGPKVHVPYRDYFLFAGHLSDSGDWGAADYAPGHPRNHMDGPHLMWPADHAWFMAADVDPDWIGVGGSRELIEELLADPRFDAAPTAYDASDWRTQ